MPFPYPVYSLVPDKNSGVNRTLSTMIAGLPFSDMG
jgi:hypothetical protein